MREIVDQQEFSSNGGLADDATGARLITVDMTAGTASLEISTPDGWLEAEVFTESGSYTFSEGFYADYRMVLAGGAKAYLI